jgi:probable F420-dependent oxidoreductase
MLGFEGIILAEQIYYPNSSQSRYHYSEDGQSIQSDAMEFADPLISFAAIASATKRLKMMTGIYVLPLRHPVEAAKNMATLARLSDNRFMLGMGAGWLKEEFDQMGVDFASRGERLDEMLTIQRSLWRGERVSFNGKHFSLDQVRIKPYPEKMIPVLAGGTSRPALRRAATCEGWYGPGNTVDELRTIVPQLLNAADNTDGDFSDYEIIAPLTTVLDAYSVEQLQEIGVTGTVSYPFLFGIGDVSTLDQKKAYMDTFASTFIN